MNNGQIQEQIKRILYFFIIVGALLLAVASFVMFSKILTGINELKLEESSISESYFSELFSIYTWWAIFYFVIGFLCFAFVLMFMVHILTKNNDETTNLKQEQRILNLEKQVKALSQRKCEKCGNIVQTTDGFCSKCGKKIGESSVTTTKKEGK